MSFQHIFSKYLSCFPQALACSTVCMITASQFLAADTLTIDRSDDQEAVLNWEVGPLAPFATRSMPVMYQLQQSDDLIHWTVLGEVTLESPKDPSVGSLVVSAESGNQFFRHVKFLTENTTGFEEEDLSIGQFQNMALQNRLFSFALMDDTDFSGADMSGAQLFGADGIATKFAHANLAGVELTACIITDSDFHAASLTGATARFTNLSQNDFSQADLRFVDFTGADLFRSDLRGADLRGAVFTNTDLRLVPLHGAIWDEMTLMADAPKMAWRIVNEGMPDADLSGLDLTGMVLSGGNLKGARLVGTRLTAVDMRGADLRGANLSETEFGLMDVRQTKIDSETVLPDTLRIIWEIVNSKQDALDLADVDLTDANLTLGYLREADLRRATLVGAVLIGADLSHANLRNANLQNVSLEGADLSFADLRGALISRRALMGAHLEETILPDGTVSSSE